MGGANPKIARSQNLTTAHYVFAPLGSHALKFPPPLWCVNDVYSRMPARWSLQQTTRAPGSDKTRGQGSFGPFTGGQNLKHLNIPNLVIATYKIFFKRTDRALDPFY